jgi:hypothetical protein
LKADVVPVDLATSSPSMVSGMRFGAAEARPRLVRLPRVAFLGDLHIDPHRLLVELFELGQLGGGVLTETRRDGYVASSDNDFHHDPFPSDCARSDGAGPDQLA